MDITEAYIEGNYARYTIRLRCDMGQLVGNTCEKLEYEASRIARPPASAGSGTVTGTVRSPPAGSSAE